MSKRFLLITGITLSILIGASVAVITSRSSSVNIVDTIEKTDLVETDVNEINDIVVENKENDNIDKNLNEIKDKELVSEKSVNFNFSVIADSEKFKGDFGFDDDVLVTFDHALKWKPELILFTGDIIAINAGSQGKRRSVQHVKNIFDRYLGDITYYIAFGNHDIEGDWKNIDIWQKIFFDKTYKANEKRVLYHSFDYENTHFVLLSTGYPLKNNIDVNQMQWLENDLKKNTKENTIIVMHAPPVTFYEKSAKKCHDLFCNPKTQAKLQIIFKENDVDLVVAGHEHVFDHKIVNGIDYIIGGNASSTNSRYKEVPSGQTFADVSIRDDAITVKGIDVDKGIIREIKIK